MANGDHVAGGVAAAAAVGSVAGAAGAGVAPTIYATLRWISFAVTEEIRRRAKVPPAEAGEIKALARRLEAIDRINESLNPGGAR